MTRTTRTRARGLRLGAAVATALAVAATGTTAAALSPATTDLAPSTEAATAAGSTVAADGSGDFRTVQEAVDAVPADNTSEHVITIQPGTYRERVLVDKPHVSLVGAGAAEDVVIVEGVSAGEGGSHRDSTTVYVTGADFRADNVTFENDHDESDSEEGNQAMALYLEADRAVIDDSRVLGDQDTFMIDDPTRAYVSDSYIEGTVDFVYGEGIAVFHRSTIYEKRDEGGPVTAARTPADSKYGFLFYRSAITGATDGTTQLGRPWGPDAQVLYRESELSATIDTAQPWTDMSDNSWTNARFLEYENTGPGATVNDNRAQLPADRADEYTPEKYLAGDDGWDPVDRSGETADSPAAQAAAGTAGGTTAVDGPRTAAAAAGEWSDVADGYATGTTGGADGETVTASTYADLEKYATAPEPYTIRVEGTLEADEMGKELKVTSNKTIIGAGDDGELVGGGFFLGEDTENVIIRNLTIRDTRMTQDDPDDKEFDYDAIQMDGATNVWIDHNRLTRMNDGLIDSRKDTTNLTVSWNELAENNKAFGIGWTENLTAQITIHHNWIHDTNQRNPSTDNVATAHLYNNYLQDVTGYGNYARGETKMVLENGYFENVTDPFYLDETAELRESGSVVVDSTGAQDSGGEAFDPAADYDYTLDDAADVPAVVTDGSGPQASIGD